jgi:hypothetical protein
MRPSRIIAVDPKYLTEHTPNGWVCLGQVDGLAYIHEAPQRKERIFLYKGDGNMVDVASYVEIESRDQAGPDDVLMIVGETGIPPWATDEGLRVIHDSAPDAFTWEAFEKAQPDLAAVLTPHQWSGE